MSVFASLIWLIVVVVLGLSLPGRLVSAADVRSWRGCRPCGFCGVAQRDGQHDQHGQHGRDDPDHACRRSSGWGSRGGRAS